MNASAIAAHYAAQLTEPSWRIHFQRSDSSSFAILRASGATRAGAPVIVVLAVTRLEGMELADVALRIARDELRAPAPTPAAAGGRLGGGGAAAQAGMRGSLPPPQAPLPLNAAVAAAFPKDLLPAGAVIKSAETVGVMTTVTVEAPSFKFTDVPAFVVALTGAGWESRTASTFPGRSPTRFPVWACRGSQEATIEVSPRAAGGADLSITVEALTQPCGRRPRAPFRDIAMPLLIVPAGASTNTGSRGGGMNDHSSNTQLATTMTPSAIGAHYLPQMTAEGWPRSGEGIDEAGSVWAARFTSKATSGEPVTAILVLTKLANSAAVDAWLRVLRR
jgi:hypothetical protein